MGYTLDNLGNKVVNSFHDDPICHVSQHYGWSLGEPFYADIRSNNSLDNLYYANTVEPVTSLLWYRQNNG